jgi:hypothetical protein
MPDGASLPRLSVAKAISPGGLLAHDFAGESWDRWRAVLRAAYAEPMSKEERRLFAEVSGGRKPPKRQVRELWIVAGRRSGKSATAAAIATIGALHDYSPYLQTGEQATIIALASDRTQAGIIHRRVAGYFQTLPALKPLVARQNDEVLELRTGTSIVVATNDFRLVRGRTIAVALFDEVGYWRGETTATPDRETYNAIEPALLTIPGSMLIAISSPYKRGGLLFDKWREAFGKDDDDVLCIHAPSRVLNPTLNERIIERRLAEDPEAGSAEYLAQWRSDVSDLFDRETLEAAVDVGVTVRPPREGVSYQVFVDVSGGRGDSFTAGVAHLERNVGVLDAALEITPPFDSEAAVKRVAELARSYGQAAVTGDQYAATWVSDAFQRENIRYRASERDKSAIFLNSLSLFTSGRVRLLDNKRLIYQLASLERRVSRFGGKERIGHPETAGARDDLANSVCGALALVSAGGPAAGWINWCREQVASAKVRLGGSFKQSDFERLGRATGAGSGSSEPAPEAPEASDAYLQALSERNVKLRHVEPVAHSRAGVFADRFAPAPESEAGPAAVSQGTPATERGATAMVQQLPGEHAPLAAGEVRLQAQPWQAFYVPAPNGGGRKFTGDAHGVIVAPSEFLPALTASGCRPV